MASCIHFSIPGCISLWYICPLSEPGSPWQSIKRNLTVFSSVCLPLRSPLKEEGSARDRAWGIHEGWVGGGGGHHSGSTTGVKVHTGKQIFALNPLLCDCAHSLVQSWRAFFFSFSDTEETWHAKAKWGSNVAGFDWTLLGWRPGRNWDLSSLQLLFMRSCAGSCLALC